MDRLLVHVTTRLRAVVPWCSHLATRWAVLERHAAWLVVVVRKGVFQRNPQS